MKTWSFGGTRDSARRAAAEPAADLTRRWYVVLLSATAGLSLALQLLLYRLGLYTVSADESERTLLAYRLTLEKAVEPSVWPPLPRIVTGLALRLHGDLVTTPRVVVGVTGLLTLGATVTLARRLFDRRLVAAVAGVLAVFVPQRLILSVAPMADIFAYLLLLLAASFLIGWLRSDRPRTLIAASLCLFLAATVRYESWFFNGVLLLYLAYRASIRRDLELRLFAASGTLLTAFPLAWVIATYVSHGSLATLSLTSEQFIAAHGHDVRLALGYDAATEFVKDAAISPAVSIGAIALVVAAVRSRRIRTWGLVLFIPLGLLSASMLATFSVPLAAPFRTDGAWVLLVTPFAAWGIVSVAQRISGATLNRLLPVVLVGCVGVVVPMVLRTQAIVRVAQRQTGALANPALGYELRSLLRSSDQRLLLDASDDLDYLNVLVSSNAPDRFVLSDDADPTEAAVYIPDRRYYVDRHDTTIVDRYLTDTFRIAKGLNMKAIRALNIGYVLARNKTFITALATDRAVVPRQTFGPWQLFSVR